MTQEMYMHINILVLSNLCWQDKTTEILEVINTGIKSAMEALVRPDQL